MTAIAVGVVVAVFVLGGLVLYFVKFRDTSGGAGQRDDVAFSNPMYEDSSGSGLGDQAQGGDSAPGGYMDVPAASAGHSAPDGAYDNMDQDGAAAGSGYMDVSHVAGHDEDDDEDV